MSGFQGQQPTPNDLQLIIGDQAISGWQEVHVVRGCERIPSSFDISATERYPGQIGAVVIPAGSPCQIKLGNDRVLTGYVDRVMPSVSAGQHSIRIQGRSKLEDIVDCSVTSKDIAGMQITVTDLVSLATRVCAPFDISVKSLAGDTIPMTVSGLAGPIPIAVLFGETAYELIERIARYVQVLVYDDTSGNVILARAGGGGSMASGFAEGVNVQAASGTLSMDQRYSEYLPAVLSYQVYSNSGTGGVVQAPVFDKSVPRYRPLYVVSEQVNIDTNLAQQRARWEMARRYGRSQAIRVTCDSWRDSAGQLWAPNSFAPVYMPSVKIAPKDPWVIGEVAFSRDASRGTTAELLLMPKEAFTQEPTILLPFGWYNPDGNPPAAGTTLGAGHGDAAG